MCTQSSAAAPPSEPTPTPTSQQSGPTLAEKRKRKLPPLRKQLRLLGTPIPNTGSTARDYLANERTFLAWARTGLGFVGIGIALSSFMTVNTAPDATTMDIAHTFRVGAYDFNTAGVLFVGLGGTFLSYALVRYFRVLVYLERGLFVPNVFGVLGITAVSAILAMAALGVFIISDHREDEDDDEQGNER